jgi:hypothetical protein
MKIHIRALASLLLTFGTAAVASSDNVQVNGELASIVYLLLSDDTASLDTDGRLIKAVDGIRCLAETAQEEEVCEFENATIVSEGGATLVRLQGFPAQHLFTAMSEEAIVLRIPGNAATAAMTVKRVGPLICMRRGATVAPFAQASTVCSFNANPA